MNRFLLLLLIFIHAVHMPAQGPYQLQGSREIPLVGSAALTAGAALILNAGMMPLTYEELEELDAAQINPFDRGATRHYSSAANQRSHYGERIPLALGVTSTLVFPAIESNKGTFGREWMTLFVIWGEANLLSASVTHLAKNWSKRPRPYLYNPEVGEEAKLTVSARKSFMSGHTNASAVNAFFMAKVFSDYFPDSRFKPVIWSVAAAIPAWTGIERYFAGKHFPTDILSAYAVGALCGYFIPRLHKSDRGSETGKLTIVPSAGFGLTGISMVLEF
jgi:hypothetical protein